MHYFHCFIVLTNFIRFVKCSCVFSWCFCVIFQAVCYHLHRLKAILVVCMHHFQCFGVLLTHFIRFVKCFCVFSGCFCVIFKHCGVISIFLSYFWGLYVVFSVFQCTLNAFQLVFNVFSCVFRVFLRYFQGLWCNF